MNLVVYKKIEIICKAITNFQTINDELELVSIHLVQKLKIIHFYQKKTNPQSKYYHNF